MSIRKIQFLMSLVFVIGYFILLGAIVFIEASDSLNMKQGENTMMGEFKILLGVMTAAVAQVLNFWFNKADKEDAKNAFPPAPVQIQQAVVPTPTYVPTPAIDLPQAEV